MEELRRICPWCAYSSPCNEHFLHVINFALNNDGESQTPVLPIIWEELQGEWIAAWQVKDPPNNKSLEDLLRRCKSSWWCHVWYRKLQRDSWSAGSKWCWQIKHFQHGNYANQENERGPVLVWRRYPAYRQPQKREHHRLGRHPLALFEH